VKTQYAVQAVIYLARQERSRVVSVSEMATVIAVSAKFLEDVLGALRAAGIVHSRRGKEGGYVLALAPAEMTVLDVVRAIEGPELLPARAPEGPLAQVTVQVFERALMAAAASLTERTIDQLAEETGRLEAARAVPYMYHL
jgi:Rrf2 family protein